MNSSTGAAQSQCRLGQVTSTPGNLGSTCPSIMNDGEQCSARCSDQYVRVGFFTCSRSVLIGQSSCLLEAHVKEVKRVTKIAATMELEIDVKASVGFEIVRDLLKKSIANTLGVSIEQVSKFNALEIGQ